MNGGAKPRVSSPAPGRSILITSQPRSPNICAQVGPASTRVRSNTRSPFNGPVGSVMSVSSLPIKVVSRYPTPRRQPLKLGAGEPRHTGERHWGECHWGERQGKEQFMSDRPPSIEGRGSWFAAAVTLGILTISYASPLLIVVGLKPIQADLETDRSVIALAGALVWVGNGIGGIP